MNGGSFLFNFQSSLRILEMEGAEREGGGARGCITLVLKGLSRGQLSPHPGHVLRARFARHLYLSYFFCEQMP